MTPGTKLGPYELIASVGKGGMGEVWRARDTRLNRDVAIKFSSQQFTDRFDREARAIAALNHSNICTLFDVGPNYLVMELIDGPTLADRIAEGPIPLDEALAIAHQIADALEAAHEKGIVHRDLKPGNVKIKPDGSVKVLDFGLAKAGGEDQQSATLDSPTIMHLPTQAGVILGTASYMAPEQARGKAVDKRADIWSFGVVLYEMVTGKRPFEGEDLTEILAAVVKTEPDLTQAPAELRRLLEACLHKDPKKRLRDIADAWGFLGSAASPAIQPAPRSGKLVWIAAATMALAAAGVSFVHFRERPPDLQAVHSTVSVPDGEIPVQAVVSPDGRHMAVTFGGDIQLRSLDSTEFTSLANTNGAAGLFWSPDSKLIGFFAEGKLKTAPAAGGPAQTICAQQGIPTATWGSSGVILFGGGLPGQPFLRVNSAGGPSVPLGKAPSPGVPWNPAFLPDGNHFFYTIINAEDSQRGLYLASLDDPVGHRLLPDQSGALYAPATPGSSLGHVLFLRGATLMAQAFDAGKLEKTGDPFPVATSVVNNGNYLPTASVSASGILTYVSDPVGRVGQLTWFDRTGKALGKVGTVQNQRGLALSPDGRNVLTQRQLGVVYSIWNTGTVSDEDTRLVEPGNTAVWSPDGKSVIYVKGQTGVYLRDMAGGASDVELFRNTNWTNPADWSRDGRFFIYSEIAQKTTGDIWYLEDPRHSPAGKPVKFLATEANENQPQFSPDGHWVAYTSNESGKFEVYIRPFPSGQGQWKVSATGGWEPRWSPDGKEIYYLAAGSRQNLTAWNAVPIHAGNGLQIGSPNKLFEVVGGSINPLYSQFRYSVAPDGRFLIYVPVGTLARTINLVTNWQKLPGTKPQ
jgi:serine/threonine protein kinase